MVKTKCMNAVARWKKSVIHLECAADSLSRSDLDELMDRFSRGDITHDEFAESLQARTRDLRYQGTAVFLESKGNHYLLTARHVLHDRVTAERDLEGQALHPFSPHPVYLYLIHRYAENRVFGIVFRVPSLDEIPNTPRDSSSRILMNLGAGPSSIWSYTFSNPDLDLAVISLQSPYSRFADDLLTAGYSPMCLADVADEPSAEGAEVFTVGYPAAMAIISEQDVSAEARQWASTSVSLPTFAFGRVAMLHDDLPFYWCDMSIYPDNSGGPVIEDGKLVGIVSGQPVIPSERFDEGEENGLPVWDVRIPFGKVVKAKFIRELLEIQAQKDANRA